MIITNREDLIQKYRGRDAPLKRYSGYLIRLREHGPGIQKPGDIVQFAKFDKDGDYRDTNGLYYDRDNYAMLDADDIITLLYNPLFPI